MKIALVQINPIIGDFSFNCLKIVERANEAYVRGCELAIFPEMVVTGYPPQDLLERPSFIQDQERAVQTMIKKLPDMNVLFGRFERNFSGNGKPLYNSAVVVRNGQVIHTTSKQLLPSYDVFDEKKPKFTFKGQFKNLYTFQRIKEYYGDNFFSSKRKE